jgi:hypothetical protein
MAVNLRKLGSLQWSECCPLNFLTICIRCVLGVEPSNREYLYCFWSHMFASRSRVWKRKYHIYENNQVEGISLGWICSSIWEELWWDSIFFWLLCIQCGNISSLLFSSNCTFAFPQIFYLLVSIPFAILSNQWPNHSNPFLSKPSCNLLTLLYLCEVGDKCHFLLCTIQFLK